MDQSICYNCFRELEEGNAGSCPHCGYDSQDKEKYPLALPHGTVLNGRYITGRVLGQGGFGVTYIANDWKRKQRVAIKEYLPDTMATRTDGRSVSAYSGERGDSFAYGKECFLKEAQTLAEFIGNPNIVRVHSYFEENGTAYFAMDYVEGISFQEYIKKQGGKIPWQEAEKILLPIMEALEAVHEKGIIHRDVTPDNIFITKDGTVKLLDFGAARYSLGDRSRSLDIVLKHGFAPKEQYTRHGRQGPYTDVYTVAASFYYAVTGRRPPDSIDRLEEDDLVPPSSLGIAIPADVENAILKGMGVQPADRYQGMAEFREALLRKENGEQNEELKEESKEEPYQELPQNEPEIIMPQQWSKRQKKKLGIILGFAVGSVAFIALAVVLISALSGNDSEMANNDYFESTNTSASTDDVCPYSCNASLECIETRGGDEEGASIDSVKASKAFYVESENDYIIEDIVDDFHDIYCNFSCSKPGMIQDITVRLYKKNGKLLEEKKCSNFEFDYYHTISSYGLCFDLSMFDFHSGVEVYYFEVIPVDANGKQLDSVKWEFTIT